MYHMIFSVGNYTIKTYINKDVALNERYQHNTLDTLS